MRFLLLSHSIYRLPAHTPHDLFLSSVRVGSFISPFHIQYLSASGSEYKLTCHSNSPYQRDTNKAASILSKQALLDVLTWLTGYRPSRLPEWLATTQVADKYLSEHDTIQTSPVSKLSSQIKQTCIFMQKQKAASVATIISPQHSTASWKKTFENSKL